MWTYPVEAFSMSRHLMGTCRMGDDPKTSVVDRNSRAHDVPNLSGGWQQFSDLRAAAADRDHSGIGVPGLGSDYQVADVTG